MFGSVILDVTIGIIFVFLLVSIICSAIREGVESILKTRAAYLELGIRELFNDVKAEGLAKAFYEHPLIAGLYAETYANKEGRIEKPTWFANGDNLPSYIPSKSFAQTLLDLAAKGPSTTVVNSDPRGPQLTVENVRRNVVYLKEPRIQRVVLTALDHAEDDLQKAQLFLEDWYNGSMDRVSGWYKRSTQWILFFIGIAVAVGMNINALKLIDYLSHHEDARNALVAQAQKIVTDSAATHMSYAEAKAALSEASLPIGWGGAPAKTDTAKSGTKEHVSPAPEKSGGVWYGFFQPVLGWLIIAFAATMGAPFWFDLLNKVMVIRSTVKPHEKSPEEASEDRQNRSGTTTVIVQGQDSGKDRDVPKKVEPVTGKVAALPEDAGDLDEEQEEDGEAAAHPLFTKDEELPIAQGGIN